MRIKWVWVAFLLFLVPALAWADSLKPILYPNEHLKEMGIKRAQADIEECMRMAQEYGVNPEIDDEIAREAVQDAAVAAVAGATIAAILGGNPGESAAISAVGASISTYSRGNLQRNAPGWVFRRFVERCLLEKGYETIGWQ